MKHDLVRIKEVKTLQDYMLWLKFDDGQERTIDLGPVLHGELFGPLKDKELFKTVSVDQEVGTVVWKNGADFDPDMLYNWETDSEALIQQIQTVS